MNAAYFPRVLVLSLALLCAVPPLARAADCTSPAGAEGSMVYNADHHVMQFCSGSGWIGMAGVNIGGASALSGLTDVTLGTLSNGEVLTYNSTSGKWENQAGGGSVTADSLDFDDFVDAMALDASTDIAVDGTEVLSVTNVGTGNSFVVNDVASDTSPFVVDASGSVGIGTNAPANLLHLQGNATNEALLRFQPNDNANFIGMEAVQASGASVIASLKVNPGTGEFRLSSAPTYFPTFYSHGVEVMRIDTSGNVGIGTTSPSEKLHVSGNVKALAYHNSSDRRLKHDIRGLEGRGLELVRKLRGVSFVWNDGGKAAMGFIAQEVEPIVPYAVSTDQKGYKSVDYIMMIAPMVEAIKTIDGEFTQAKGMIEALKTENAKLRTELVQLRDQQTADKAAILQEISTIKATMH